MLDLMIFEVFSNLHDSVTAVASAGVVSTWPSKRWPCYRRPSRGQPFPTDPNQNQL